MNTEQSHTNNAALASQQPWEERVQQPASCCCCWDYEVFSRHHFHFSRSKDTCLLLLRCCDTTLHPPDDLNFHILSLFVNVSCFLWRKYFVMRADCLIIPSRSCCSGKEVLITIPPLICIHQQMFSGNFTCSVSLPPPKLGQLEIKRL